MADLHDGDKAAPRISSSDTQAVKAPDLEQSSKIGDVSGSPNAALTAVEANRTNASDGSLRDRHHLMGAQEDSIEINFPGGKVSRQTKLTERDLATSSSAHFPTDRAVPPAPHTPQSKIDSVTILPAESSSQKFVHFLSAAAHRASDPIAYKTYIQDEITKMVGVGEGLSSARDHTKDSAAAAWRALNDGTVAEFLSKPSALNDPMYKLVTAAFEALPKDSQSAHKALDNLGQHLLKANQDYNSKSPRDKGHVIGETMFAMVNPEGSTEGGEALLKAADRVATGVDAAVMSGVQKAHIAVQELSRTSPVVAAQTKQMLLDYTHKMGMNSQEMELAGIPRGYFEGMRAHDSYPTIVREKGEKVAHDVVAKSAGDARHAVVDFEKLSPAEQRGLVIEAKAAAIRLEAQAKLAEPQITANLVELAAQNGGHMIGLEHRFKSLQSLEDKILRDTPPEKMKDALRYTTIYPVDEIALKANQSIADLAKSGCEIIKVKNTFELNEAYKGINCVFKTPGGQMFELQFHTGESFAVKERVNHGLYEVDRGLYRFSHERGKLVLKAQGDIEPLTAKKFAALSEYPELESMALRLKDFRAASSDDVKVFAKAISDQMVDNASKIKIPPRIGLIKDFSKAGEI